jgi:hypothetical protein
VDIRYVWSMMKCGASQRNQRGWLSNRGANEALYNSSRRFTTAAVSVAATMPTPRSSRVIAVS